MNEKDQAFYTRGHNPTVAVLRQKLAALEGAEDALLFSSGSAAISSAVLAHVQSGDQIICIANPYSWTDKLLTKMLPRFGVETVFADNGDIETFQNIITDKTKMIILESPNSVTFEQQDLVKIAQLAKAHNILTLCDNSYATPLKQKPIALGIDLVAHSVTKYLNGHSDVVAGTICGRRELIDSIFHGPYMTLGGVINAHDAWLIIRGLRTLEIRLERTTQSALKIVQFLRQHETVDRVYYPDQLGTGLFSITLKTDELSQIELFCNSLKYFLMTCSWGGHESLIFPMCALNHSQNYQASQERPVSLIRFSIGLESSDELIADLTQALSLIK